MWENPGMEWSVLGWCSVAATDFILVPPLPRISGLLAVAQPRPGGFSWSGVSQILGSFVVLGGHLSPSG